jgi:MFS family permease
MSAPQPVGDIEPLVERGLLRNRNFLAIWSAQVLSQTAANALTSALIVLVFERTQANTATSWLILFSIIPAVVFGPLAGIAVDRVDRKLVLVTTNVLRGVAVLLLVPFVDNVAALYVVNILVASVTVFFVPAEAATLPKIVRKKDLLAANSLFSLTFNGAFFFGFSILAPAVLRLYGYEALLILLTVMYAVSAGLCGLLPKAEPVTQTLTIDVAGVAVKQTQSDIAEAIGYLREHRRLSWVLVYVALTFMLIAVAGALAPGFVTRELDLGERDIYVLSLSAGLGVALGLAAINLLGRRLPRVTAIHRGLLTGGLALVALAAAGPLLRVARAFVAGDPQLYFVGLVVVAAVVFGVAYVFITVPSFTLLQEELQDDMRGRVFSVLNMLVSVVSLVPLLAVGQIADSFGVGPVFAGAGAVVLLVWLMGRRIDLPRDTRSPTSTQTPS